MISEARQRERTAWLVGLVNLATFTWATNMTLARWLRNDII